jgi:hypothetical protein
MALAASWFHLDGQAVIGSRRRTDILEHDPNGKAAQDYITAFEKITDQIEGTGSPNHVKAETTA